MPNPQQQGQNQQLQKHAAQHGKKREKALKQLGEMGMSPEEVQQLGIRHPAQFLHQYRGGAGPAVRRMHMLTLASKPYKKPETTLETELTDPESQASIQSAEEDLNAQVNLRKEEDPMIGQMQDYLSARLGIGLTPGEEAAIRGELRAPVEQAYDQAVRSAGQAGAAAGIAPGSGVSIARGQQAQQARQQGLSNVENEIIQADLARKAQIEQEAAGQIGAEEAARAFDVGAQQQQQNLQLRQLALAEGSLGGLANLREGEREFDVTFTESQRQAELQRRLWEKFGASLEPSGLEIASGVVGGLVGGLSGSGGGGGGGGGMGGLIGAFGGGG